MEYEAGMEGESKRSWWERVVDGYAQKIFYKCIEFSRNRMKLFEKTRRVSF